MAYKREIVLFIITALATLSAVYYFFGDMEEGKNVAQTDLYTLTAPSPAAILSVNRPAAFAKLILTKQPVYQAFASEIPEIFLSIVQKNTAIPALQFSFHTQGVVMYAKADKSTVDNIENKILKSSFGAFEPQKQKKGEITFTYFPDAGNRFFGYYQYEGIWVASYSKKLLEEVATMQTYHTNQLQKEQIHLCKSLDRNAPLNLLIRSEKLNLYVKTTPPSGRSTTGGWEPTCLRAKATSVISAACLTMPRPTRSTGLSPIRFRYGSNSISRNSISPARATKRTGKCFIRGALPPRSRHKPDAHAGAVSFRPRHASLSGDSYE